MKKIYNFVLLIAVILSFVQCNKEENKSVIVAEVNDQKLYEHEFRSLFTEEEWQTATPEQKNKVINDWIEITLLAEEAKKRGLHKKPEVKFNIKYAERTLLANELLAQQLKNVYVNTDEVFDYYNLHRNDFLRNRRFYKIQEFIAPNWTISDSAITLFNEGEAFYVVAKNLGRDYTVKTISSNDVTPAFWDFISGMQRWHIRIIEDEGVIKIVQLLNTINEEQAIPFQNISDSLYNILIEQKREEFLANALDSLQISYKVKIY
ncbi:MAG TPA: hypothetical protein ENG70_05205 [Candidatus Cloacimonetes bacterium]|nr:hypothetical protein [Candidatus Cloacimonadota bacterium]HEX38236.1 hypothetical protein [Candidatus Cloacimonadota bacterium]